MTNPVNPPLSDQAHTQRLLDLIRAAHASAQPVDSLCASLGVSQGMFYRLVDELRTTFGVVLCTDGDVHVTDIGVFNAARLFAHTPRSRAQWREVTEFGINPVGQKVGQLAVLSRVGREMYNTRMAVIYRCQCDCGKVLDLPAHKLRSGNPAAQMRSCYDCRYTRTCLTCGKTFSSVVPSNSCSDACRIKRRQALGKAQYANHKDADTHDETGNKAATEDGNEDFCRS